MGITYICHMDYTILSATQGDVLPSLQPKLVQDLSILDGWKWVMSNWLFYRASIANALAPTLGVASFISYTGHTTTSWQTETQEIKSPLNTTQRDTAYTSSCAYVPQPDRRETQQSVVSMHDLHVYLKINTNYTLVCLYDENTHVNLHAN